MGCCFTAARLEENPDSGNDDAPGNNVNLPHHPPSQSPVVETAPIPQYTFAELREATNGFSHQNRLSKGGGILPNSVYRGRLHGLPQGRQQIAVKRFSEIAWPDVELFREEAIRAGRLRHPRIARLIGYCCEGDQRLLVAEFMPKDSLATHLFKTKYKTMEWSMRLRVAYYIAEALEYCSNEGRPLYHDLSSYKVLFNEAGFPCLSCFGLVKNRRDGRCFNTNLSYMTPECVGGRTTREGMLFSFGIVLLDLLRGKKMAPENVVELILGRRIPVIMDSRLRGEYSTEEATTLLELAYQCLRPKAKDRPTINDVIATLVQILRNAGEPSNAMPRT